MPLIKLKKRSLQPDTIIYIFFYHSLTPSFELFFNYYLPLSDIIVRTLFFFSICHINIIDTKNKFQPRVINFFLKKYLDKINKQRFALRSTTFFLDVKLRKTLHGFIIDSSGIISDFSACIFFDSLKLIYNI